MAWTPEYGKLYRERNWERIKAGVADWKRRNREKVNASARRSFAKNPRREYAKRDRWREKYPEKARAKDAKRRANERAKEEAERARIAGRPRPNICDVCEQNIIRIVFDHCHAKGHFRGWLCDRCNRVLGLIKDDPKLLRSLAEYLERSP